MILRERASIHSNNSECRLLVHPRNSPIDATMLGCENLTTVPIEVTLNLSRMGSCLKSGGNNIVKKVVQPNRIEFLTHLRRENVQALPARLEVDFKWRIVEQ